MSLISKLLGIGSDSTEVPSESTTETAIAIDNDTQQDITESPLKLKNERNIAIAQFLDMYITNPDPRYAVLLTGKWGCGKSYFMDRWLEKYNQPNEIGNEEDIVLKPFMVSLYGKTDISQITEDIDRLVNPFVYSKLYKFGKNAFKLLGKVALRTDLDFNNDGSNDATITGSLDSLKVFQSDDKNIKGVKFLIFDDLERCQVEMKQLLGYINYFVEKCNCHVVIIGDETHATDSGKKQLAEFKEKTVGRQFEIEPEIEFALDEFLTKDIPSVDWLTDKKGTLIKVFLASQTKNLRILRQAVYDFKMVLLSLNGELVENDKTFLEGFMITYFATCYGLKGEYNGPLNNYAINNLTKEDRAKVEEWYCKYSSLSDSNLDILNSGHITQIIESVNTGKSLQSYLEDLLTQNQTPPSVIERISQFMHMDKPEFESTCMELEQTLNNDQLNNIYMVGRGLAYLGYFDVKGMRVLSKKTQNIILRNVKNKLRNAQDQDEIHRIRKHFVQGVNSFNSQVDMPQIKAIVTEVNATFENKKISLPNKLIDVLSNLSDDNVGQLEIIDNDAMPDGQKAYQLSSIFKDIDGKQLHKKIAALSNKGKQTFRQFLVMHYHLSSQIDFAHYYKDDTSTLSELEKLLNNDLNKATSIDKYTLEKLIGSINHCLQRCNGDNNAIA